MSEITVFGTSYAVPVIKDQRFDSLQEDIKETKERIARSERPKGFLGLLSRRPELEPAERLELMESLVRNYDELIRVLKDKIVSCREAFLRIGEGVEAEFSRRLAELKVAEERRSELESRLAARGKPDAAGAMAESQERIRAMTKDLARATVLIVRKLRHALDALETLAGDDEAQRRVYEQLRGEVALFREVYEFNRDLSELERAIAEITRIALSFDGMLRDNLGPLSILIDEIGTVDARLGESLAEIERLSVELEEGRRGRPGRDLLSDELVSRLVAVRIKEDAVAGIVASLADPSADRFTTDFSVEVSSGGDRGLDFDALACNMAELVRRGLSALNGSSSETLVLEPLEPMAQAAALGPARTPTPLAPSAVPGPPVPPESPAPPEPPETDVKDASRAKPATPPTVARESPAWLRSRPPYTASISRAAPTLVLFLLDRSGSMDEDYYGGLTRAQYLASVVDSAIAELAVRCSKADGVRDYFHIGTLGYGGERVVPALTGPLFEAPWQPISRVASNPAELVRVSGKPPKPRWIEALAVGGTPMKEALEEACRLVASWCDAYPNSYPPTVINITDGEPSTGSPEAAAAVLRRLHTNDGEALLFNLHVGGRGECVFPASERGLSENGQLLYRMSSRFPPHLRERAEESGFRPEPEARFFAYGAGADLATRFLDLGTRPARLA